MCKFRTKCLLNDNVLHFEILFILFGRAGETLNIILRMQGSEGHGDECHCNSCHYPWQYVLSECGIVNIAIEIVNND